MKPSKVFFTDLHTSFGVSLPEKLKKLVRAAGLAKLPLADSFTAIKIHFGEPGNLAFLRPAYAAALAEVLKEEGAHPFLTDCNTLYPGKRKNALEHLESAYRNGFTPYAVGCQVVIADGLKGTDDVAVKIPHGELLQEAYVGRAVMDADVVISLNHFKGHELTGIGGAIKNVGMGCGSRAGKKAMHCDGITEVDQNLCVGCGRCVKSCANDGPRVVNGKAAIDPKKCVGCGRCIGVCPKDAIAPVWSQAAGCVDRKMAEYAAAVLTGRPHFHVSLVMDVSPCCDCHAENDCAIVPNVGIFASADPVALDAACADAVNRAPLLPGSALARQGGKAGQDYFKTLFPESDWTLQLRHAEKLGLGTMQYELVTIP